MSTDRTDNEPLFKYLRITCDLKDILKSDSIACVNVTEKALFIGTEWGKLFVLDHEGNNISHHSFQQHILPINQISVDAKGEYIATCSDDGKVSQKKPYWISFYLSSLLDLHQLLVHRREMSNTQPRTSNQVHRDRSKLLKIRLWSTIHHRRF